MNTTNSFIKIPSIEKISINNFSLFNQNWTYDIKSGLNLFIGVNGLGKTTTIRLLMYGLVGGVDKEIAPKTFMGYKKHIQKETQEPPSIALSFSCGKHSFKLTRLIEQDIITDLVVDNEKKEITSSKYSSLNEWYIKILNDLCGITEIEDLYFLLKFLFIREEEGEYLFWNQNAQAKIFRLLFNQSSFQKKFQKLEEELQSADTKYRGNKDVQAQFKKNRDSLIKLRNESINKGKSVTGKDEIQVELSKTLKSIDSQETNKDSLIKKIRILHDNLKMHESKVSSSINTINTLSEEKLFLEKNLYKNIYHDKSLPLAINKLSTHGICIFCNNRPKQDKIEAIIKKINYDHNCPVCEEGLQKDKNENLMPENDKVIDRLNQITDSINQEKITINSFKKKIASISENSLIEVKDKKESIEQELDKLKLKKYSLTEKLDTFESDDDKDYTEYDSAIKALNDRIDFYQTEYIDPAKIDFDVALKDIDKENKKMNKVIKSFYEDLNIIFNSFASSYFDSDCKLHEISTKKPRGFEIPITYFVPYFEENARIYISGLSKSEAILLEYLFRMSLIQLFYKKSGNIPFLIIETSEGSFDFSNTEDLAEAFIHFSSTKIPTVLITNLSKMDFLNKIIESFKLKEKDSRIFNFFKYSHLSSKQNKRKQIFEEKLEELKINFK